MKNTDHIEEFIDLIEAVKASGSWSWEEVDQVYQFQYRFNSVYRSWVDGLDRYIKKISAIEDLTFLPIQFFKSGLVYSAPNPPEKDFQSSGTTGQIRSRHRIWKLADYHTRCRSCFSHAYGAVGDYRHLFYLPFYRDNRHSSLISMASHFIDITKDRGSRFVGDLAHLENELGKSDAPSVLWTVTFGAMDILDYGLILDHPALIFLETGGSKGQRKVLPKTELHQKLRTRGSNLTVGSEYGMCELSSQCYFVDGKFQCPPGFRVITTEIDDPLTLTRGSGERGRIGIIDLANVHSCAFIETEDVGRVWADHSFTLEGRLDTAELRGCNLMYRKEDLFD